MRITDRPDRMVAEQISRWYVAPMMPPHCDLERHLTERRTLAEVQAKRRAVTEALERRLLAFAPEPPQDEAHQHDEDTSPIDALRTMAARYVKLALTLSDPRAIAVVKACVRDLEAEAASLARMSQRRHVASSSLDAR